MSESVRRESVPKGGGWPQMNVYVCDDGQSRDGRLNACLLRRLCRGKDSPQIPGSKQCAKNKRMLENATQSRRDKGRVAPSAIKASSRWHRKEQGIPVQPRADPLTIHVLLLAHGCAAQPPMQSDPGSAAPASLFLARSPFAHDRPDPFADLLRRTAAPRRYCGPFR
jgi:hypothetical protein